jgi:hypothetical protein
MKEFTPIQITCGQHVKAMERRAMGSHWNWETRIMTSGYPNLVLVSLLAIEFFVNSGKHSTRTLGLVQNWVRFFFNLQKSTLAFKGDETLKCTILLW